MGIMKPLGPFGVGVLCDWGVVLFIQSATIKLFLSGFSKKAWKGLFSPFRDATMIPV